MLWPSGRCGIGSDRAVKARACSERSVISIGFFLSRVAVAVRALRMTDMPVVDPGDATVPGGDVERAGGTDQDSPGVNPGLLACRDVRPDRDCKNNGSVSYSVVTRGADGSRWVVHDVDELVNTVFSGLSPLVVEDVADERKQIRVRTPNGSAACPACGAETARVHGYHERSVADVSVDARRVVVLVRIRRLICPTRGCRQTFREQLPGVLERYQRRTPRLTSQIGVVVRELAGCAGRRALSALAVHLSRHTALRILLRLPLPQQRIPRVLGVDDFALRRRHRYATASSWPDAPSPPKERQSRMDRSG